jgi:hypothetical protein
MNAPARARGESAGKVAVTGRRQALAGRCRTRWRCALFAPQSNNVPAAGPQGLFRGCTNIFLLKFFPLGGCAQLGLPSSRRMMPIEEKTLAGIACHTESGRTRLPDPQTAFLTRSRRFLFCFPFTPLTPCENSCPGVGIIPRKAPARSLPSRGSAPDHPRSQKRKKAGKRRMGILRFPASVRETGRKAFVSRAGGARRGRRWSCAGR